jgi:hypothetical protein
MATTAVKPGSLAMSQLCRNRVRSRPEVTGVAGPVRHRGERTPIGHGLAPCHGHMRQRPRTLSPRSAARMPPGMKNAGAPPVRQKTTASGALQRSFAWRGSTLSAYRPGQGRAGGEGDQVEPTGISIATGATTTFLVRVVSRWRRWEVPRLGREGGS